MRNHSNDIGRIATTLIRAYQAVISPLLGPRCRFYPSCSEYARTCFEKYTPLKAAAKISGRLARCHPLHPGGFDLP